jgi:caffeoyl-CoA O-methyltransferase
MGFTNTNRLAGGVVAYARTLREQGRLNESQFKGVNHVFDGRVGEIITDDMTSTCINCGAPCNVQTDCANVRCPRPFETRMFVQCPVCATTLAGACSDECSSILTSGAGSEAVLAAPARLAGSTDRRHDEAYAIAMTEPEPPLLTELRVETKSKFAGRAHMVSGPLEASLLRMLVSLTGARRLLEIGTFTGYSALYMARALSEGGKLVTCELDEEVAAVAASYFARDTEHGHKIELRLGNAREVVDEMAAASAEPFDMVFLDADKNYSGYFEVLMGGILRVGGLMVVDNVLFRGQVSQLWARESSSEENDAGASVAVKDVKDIVLARRRLKSLENVRKTARKLGAFNQLAVDDPRAEVVMLPIRDGITLIRRLA